MTSKPTLVDELRAALAADGVVVEADLPQRLVDVVVEYIAGSDVTVEGVPMPIDLALPLIERGVLKISVLPRPTRPPNWWPDRRSPDPCPTSSPSSTPCWPIPTRSS